MEKVHRIDTIAAYNEIAGHETLHPMVSVINFSKSKPWNWPAGPATSIKINYGFYGVFLKEVKCGDLKYGCDYYDYQEGSLLFFAPGQTFEVENFGEKFQPKGFALLFHPEFIRGTSLGKRIQEYTFFGYQSNEALHLSKRERKIILDSFSKIQYELSHAIDHHTKRLMISNIELFLNYCVRFYDRQFTTRDTVIKGVIQRLDELLNTFFNSDKPQAIGLPTVAYCASELNFSPNYFGDLIKKETGRTAHEYIQDKLISVAKDKIYDQTKSLSEIASELGFKYPQHFTRLFKQLVGQTPNEYRHLN
jgi:AraC family transcriptional regulator, transcriptional activator of pobA